MFDLNKTMKEHIYPALQESQSAEDTGRMLAKILSSVFNTYSTKTIAETCSKNVIVETHKTTQQQIMLGVIYFLKAMSENQYADERNEAAVKAAKVAYQALQDAHLTYLPMV